MSQYRTRVSLVRNFLAALGSRDQGRDPMFYLGIIQKMKGEWYNQEGLQKQMLFMRCAYESQVDQLTLFPFPGLKIINIRGSALLTLDLIIINHFVTRLQPENQLLELSLRDQLLCASGLRALLPCLHLIRTVRAPQSHLRCQGDQNQPGCSYSHRQ